MTQDYVALAIAAIAVAYLARRIFWRSRATARAPSVAVSPRLSRALRRLDR